MKNDNTNLFKNLLWVLLGVLIAAVVGYFVWTGVRL